MKATPRQMGCQKLWQRQMAAALNDSGQTLRNAIENNKIKLDTPWTEYSVQDAFSDVYMAKMYPHAESIKDLSSTEISDLNTATNHGISQVFNVSVPFPSEHELMLRDKGVIE